MKILEKSTLGIRLTLGFLFCAFLTALSGGAGMWSLQQIQSKMEKTTADISETINRQNAHTLQFMKLRGLIDEILRSHSILGLAEINKKLEEMEVNGSVKNKDKKADILEDVRKLSILKEKQLNALNDLATLRKENTEGIDNIAKLVVDIVDNTEFESTIMIEDAKAEISDNLDGLFSTVNKEDSGRKVSNAASELRDRFNKTSAETQKAISIIKAALQVRAYCNELNAITKDVLLSTESAYIDYIVLNIESLFQSTKEQIALLGEGEISANLIIGLDNLSGHIKRMSKVKNIVLATQAQLKKASDDIGQQMVIIDEQMVKASLEMKSGIDTSFEGYNRLVGRWQVIELALVLGAFILAILIGLFVSGSIKKPLAKAVNMLKDIAEGEGDLTRRLEVSSADEIGGLARWFNTFVIKIQDIIKDVADDAERLGDSSKVLSNISEQMSQGSKQTSVKSNTVATASAEMSSSLHSAADDMEQTSENVNMVAASIEEMTSTVNEIAQNSNNARRITDEAVSQAENASSRVGNLNSAAQDVNKITETIAEISEQTNLLALNATIEAARAGEAGKGFAVVAGEIKNLAHQTADATTEIKRKLSGIQNSTGETISNIERITQVINDVNDIVDTIASAVEEQSISTKEIAGNLSQASKRVNGVSAKMSESTSVSEDITRDISEVNQAAQGMSDSSSQVSRNARELASLSENLMNQVRKFKIEKNESIEPADKKMEGYSAGALNSSISILTSLKIK